MPPPAAAAPSTAAFCALLVADYKHLATNVDTTSLPARERILEDYVAFTPTVVAAAPPAISAAASTYLGGMARAVGALAAAGLDVRKAPKSDIGAVLFDPSMQAAGRDVAAFSDRYCRYDLAAGGAPSP